MDVLRLLYLPIVAAIVLTGIHTFLGLRMVQRRIVFADLAIAQIAALGTAIAWLAGNDLHDPRAYLWSFGFTILGAGLFSLARVRRGSPVSQEALIGTVYAVAASAAILVISRTPQGSEHLRDIVIGDLLRVSRTAVAEIAVVSLLVAVAHVVFGNRFLPAAGAEREQGATPRLVDFFFYGTLGAAVTASVATAGVLLVFGWLVIPPMAAALVSPSVGRRLLIGWSLGAIVSALAIVASFLLDLPTSPAIVCMMGFALAIVGIVQRMRRPHSG